MKGSQQKYTFLNSKKCNYCQIEKKNAKLPETKCRKFHKSQKIAKLLKSFKFHILRKLSEFPNCWKFQKITCLNHRKSRKDKRKYLINLHTVFQIAENFTKLEKMAWIANKIDRISKFLIAHIATWITENFKKIARIDKIAQSHIAKKFPVSH